MILRTMVIVLALSVFVCAQDNNAMFGLKWGMSTQQVKALGISLEKKSAEWNFSTYVADTMPKALSFGESYVLIFDDNSLVKMKMVSTDITEDPYGTEGKELFDRAVEMLSKSYKVEKVFCKSGLELYEDSDEFYECLNYEGCGYWVTGFVGENKSIVAQLEGIRRGTGYLTITAEANIFDKSLEKYKKLKEADDSQAFE
jgi:hypothetical protein